MENKSGPLQTAGAQDTAAESESLHARVQSACFACAPEHPSGLRLVFTRGADGSVSAQWTPGPRWEGHPGIAHGGIISTVLDEAMSKATAAAGYHAFTAELRVRFRRHTASAGAHVVRGWVVDKASRRIQTEAAVISADGEETAHAWASFLELPKNRRVAE